MENSIKPFWDNFSEVWQRVQGPPDLYTPPPPEPPVPGSALQEGRRQRSQRLRQLAEDCRTAAEEYRHRAASAPHGKRAQLLQLTQMEQRRARVLHNLARW